MSAMLRLVKEAMSMLPQKIPEALPMPSYHYATGKASGIFCYGSGHQEASFSHLKGGQKYSKPQKRTVQIIPPTSRPATTEDSPGPNHVREVTAAVALSGDESFSCLAGAGIADLDCGAARVGAAEFDLALLCCRTALPALALSLSS